jgi:hypothetical protein
METEMKKPFLILPVVMIPTTAHAMCELKGRIHAHTEASAKSPVFHEVISGPIYVRFEKKGWSYVDVQMDFKEMNDSFKEAVGWAFVHGGWVRSDQIECNE